jgi:hypothetical protein
MISPTCPLMYRQLYNAYRKRYRGLIKRELDKQTKQILNGEQPNKEGLKNTLRNLQQGASKAMAKHSYTKIRKSAGIKDSMTPEQKWADIMRILIEKSLEKLVDDITETTKEKVRQALIKGVQENWDLRKIIQEIEKAGVNAYRAELIARTETTKAANQGALLGAVSTGLQSVKEWIAILDDRTRRTPRDMFDHFTMDGKQVPIDELFTVTGSESTASMEYPGDPSGGLGNICNCRCTIGFEALRDANDKPIPIQGGLRGAAGEMWNLWNNPVFLQVNRGVYEALPG